MPKVTYNALSDTTIRNSKSRPKQFKILDGQGLYVLIHPNGSKYFRYRYIHEGKEKVMALGVYPETTLEEAREKRINAQRLIKQGLDPVLFRKEDQAKRKQEELGISKTAVYAHRKNAKEGGDINFFNHSTS